MSPYARISLPVRGRPNETAFVWPGLQWWSGGFFFLKNAGGKERGRRGESWKPEIQRRRHVALPMAEILTLLRAIDGPYATPKPWSMSHEFALNAWIDLSRLTNIRLRNQEHRLTSLAEIQKWNRMKTKRAERISTHLSSTPRRLPIPQHPKHRSRTHARTFPLQRSSSQLDQNRVVLAKPPLSTASQPRLMRSWFHAAVGSGSGARSTRLPPCLGGRGMSSGSFFLFRGGGVVCRGGRGPE
jgi:hypothetical protein